jgi:SAM-dependent methyltransferase
MSEGFERYTCTGTAVNRARMREVVLRHVPGDRPIRVLDVGCGTGALLLDLAAALPMASLSGVDISPSNIDEARCSSRRGADGRVTFECADYLTYSIPSMDVIVSDNTLHLIQSDTAQLFAKLARDLVPGGLLIAVLPSASAFNSLLFGARRTLRAIRSPLTDGAIMLLGRLLHPSMEPALLRERIHYMYRLPERIMTRALKQSLAVVHGLAAIGEYAYPHSSIAQPQHIVTVFRKHLR